MGVQQPVDEAGSLLTVVLTLPFGHTNSFLSLCLLLQKHFFSCISSLDRKSLKLKKNTVDIKY